MFTSKKNRIIFFSPIYSPDIGGPATQGKYFVNLLAENEFEVVVIKYSKNIESVISDNIKVISLGWNENVSLLGHLVRIIKGVFLSFFLILYYRPKLVISNTVSLTGLILCLVSKLFKVPTLLKFAGDWVLETYLAQNAERDYEDLPERLNSRIFSRILFSFEKFCLNQISLIWVISKFRESYVLKIVNHKRVWLKNNFHDLPNVSQIEKNLSDNNLVCITASRIVPHKRLPILIDLISQVDGAVLIICGSGPEFDQLKVKMNNTTVGCSNRIFLVGEVTRDLLYFLFSLSDLYVSWSSEEGAPNVYIEAMNFGLPIIGSYNGGGDEMFESDESHFTVLDFQEDIFVSKIRELTKNRSILKQMQRAAFFESLRYSKARNESEYLDKVKSLIL